MKKTYQNPAIEVVRIETHKMLAESTTMPISRDTTSTLDARGFDFDDDEEY
ncbi:MAG: hypothetical protein IJ155_01605 [Prevotella sp.]|nr:hypothetical protein [Prevotella sp.]